MRHLSTEPHQIQPATEISWSANIRVSLTESAAGGEEQGTPNNVREYTSVPLAGRRR